MQSKPSADLELIDLEEYWLILKRRWLPSTIGAVAVITAAVLFTIIQKPIYQGEGKLLLKKINATSSVTGLGEADQLASVGQQSNPLETEAEVIRSAPIVLKTIQSLNLKNKAGEPIKYEDFIDNLKVMTIKATDVLLITYKSPDPREAAAVVDKLMSIYLETNILTNRAETTAARKFIESQLPKSEANVRRADLALRQLKENYGVIAIDDEAKNTVAAISSLESQITKTRVDFVNSDSRSKAFQSKLGMGLQEAISASAISQSVGVQKALEEFQTVQRELSLERTKYTEESPTIVALRERETALRRLLQSQVSQVLNSQRSAYEGNLQVGELQQRMIEQFVASDLERFSLANQIEVYNQQYSFYRNKLSKLPKLQQDEKELERNLEAAQSSYGNLLGKFEEVQIKENQNVGNAEIVSNSLIPDDPVAPRKTLNAAIGIFLGILTGIITAFILEVRDKSVKTLTEARELLGYNLLVSIPDFKKVNSRNRYLMPTVNSSVPMRDQPRSPISEAYRILYSTLKFINLGKTWNVISVTSSVPGEGKSTVSANLAAAIAETSNKVLLIDADLRAGSQHTLWNISNGQGLSNVLAGKADPVPRMVMENLYILTCGDKPSNPVNLIDSRQMASLLETFSQEYDFVIIDSPPLLVAADSSILGKMADGVLIVVRPGVVDSSSALFAKETIEQVGLNIFGQIANGVDPEVGVNSNLYYASGYYSKDYLVLPEAEKFDLVVSKNSAKAAKENENSFNDNDL